MCRGEGVCEPYPNPNPALTLTLARVSGCGVSGRMGMRRLP